MALRRAIAAARLEFSEPPAITRRGMDRGVETADAAGVMAGADARTSACVDARAGLGLALGTVLAPLAIESARVRLGAEEASAFLPAPDKALRLASASARPLIPFALVC
jgi:hypothetical protein